MTYEFLSKNIQRASVLEMYRSDATRRPIVYLDDEHAGATRYFRTHGVPTKHLIPVTRSHVDAETIRDLTKVTCVARSIDDYVTTLERDSCSVVWLDYTCRTLCPDVLRTCLEVAPHVSVTLSTRGRRRSEMVSDIRDVAKRHGTLLESPTFYKGKSDVENMVRFVIARPAEEHRAGEEEHRAGDRIYARWRGGTWLTAVVTHVGDRRLRVLFDCDGVETCVAPSSVRRNDTVVTTARLDGMVGSTLRMPQRLWRDTTGYENVRTIGKAFVFRVTKRYANKNRYAVTAISKATHRPMSRPERFTLTYEQLACFTTRRGP